MHNVNKNKSLVIVTMAILIGSSFTILSTMTSTKASTIFSSGFETGDFEGFSWDSGCSVQSSVKNTGSYAAIFPTSTDDCCCYETSLSTVDVREYVRISTLPDSWETINLMRLWTADYEDIAIVTFDNNDGSYYLTLYHAYPSEDWNGYEFSLAVNTWYCIELRYVKSPSAGEYRLYLNGQEVVTLTGLNTNSATVGQVLIGRQWDDATTNLYVDDVVIADSYIGPLDQSPVYYNLAINASGSGSINPDVGSYQYSNGSLANVSAIAGLGWMFSYWLRNGTNVGSANPYEFTVNANYNLTAVFTLANQNQIIFNSGFESGSLSDFTGQRDVNGTSTVASEFTIVHSGSYSGIFTITANGGYADTYKTLASANSAVYDEFYVRFSELPTSGKGVNLGFVTNTAAGGYEPIAAIGLVYYNVLGSVVWKMSYLKNGVYTTLYDSVVPPVTPSTNTWYKIGLAVNVSGSLGTVETYINGVKDSDLSDTSYFDNNDVGNVNMLFYGVDGYTEATYPVSVWIDDITYTDPPPATTQDGRSVVSCQNILSSQFKTGYTSQQSLKFYMPDQAQVTSQAMLIIHGESNNGQQSTPLTITLNGAQVYSGTISSSVYFYLDFNVSSIVYWWGQNTTYPYEWKYNTANIVFSTSGDACWNVKVDVWVTYKASNNFNRVSDTWAQWYEIHQGTQSTASFNTPLPDSRAFETSISISWHHNTDNTPRTLYLYVNGYEVTQWTILDDSTVSYDITAYVMGIAGGDIYVCSSKPSVEIGLKLYSPTSNWGFCGNITTLTRPCVAPDSSTYWSEDYYSQTSHAGNIYHTFSDGSNTLFGTYSFETIGKSNNVVDSPTFSSFVTIAPFTEGYYSRILLSMNMHVRVIKPNGQNDSINFIYAAPGQNGGSSMVGPLLTANGGVLCLSLLTAAVEIPFSTLILGAMSELVAYGGSIDELTYDYETGGAYMQYASTEEGPKSFVFRYEPTFTGGAGIYTIVTETHFMIIQPNGEKESSFSFTNSFDFYYNVKTDNFDDNIRNGAFWNALGANGGWTHESNGQLRVVVPSGTGQAQAGYVTKSSYNFYNCITSIDVSEHDNLGEMTLMICNSKTTSSDPYSLDNWYRIIKSNGYVVVQSKINGTITDLITTTTWQGATGNLQIYVADGTMSFYENGQYKCSTNFGLPSYYCYIYVMTSSNSAVNYGSDAFDNYYLK